MDGSRYYPFLLGQTERGAHAGEPVHPYGLRLGCLTRRETARFYVNARWKAGYLAGRPRRDQPDSARLARQSVGSPSWSPDGKWIVYYVQAGQSGIYVVSADGEHSQLSRTTSGETRPSVSPDGKWVYFPSASGCERYLEGAMGRRNADSGYGDGGLTPCRRLTGSGSITVGSGRLAGSVGRGTGNRGLGRDSAGYSTVAGNLSNIRGVMVSALPWSSTTVDRPLPRRLPVPLRRGTGLPGVGHRSIARDPRGLRGAPRAPGERPGAGGKLPLTANAPIRSPGCIHTKKPAKSAGAKSLA